MPSSKVHFYMSGDGTVPVLDWLRQLRQQDRRGYAKCVVRIQRLAAEGHALRRPEADYLRDGIHELRARQGHVNYRILYFFHGQNVAILAHAMTKEREIPDAEIERALRRKAAFEENPKRHLYEESHGEEDS
ncbi:MAG TPA: type II toxin-antitoxin system RelE/ParE family toxin [Thermoanaerobaculia bacterium]